MKINLIPPSDKDAKWMKDNFKTFNFYNMSNKDLNKFIKLGEYFKGHYVQLDGETYYPDRGVLNHNLETVNNILSRRYNKYILIISIVTLILIIVQIALGFIYG